MYISSITISGFRNFEQNTIDFNDGMNVIIGHNNAGKTNLLKALSLVIDSKTTKRLEVDDFCKHINFDEIKENPPQITIALTISQSKNEQLNTDDLVTVSNWLTKLEEPYEAKLTYTFFLPIKDRENYVKALAEVTDIETAWRIIRHDFIKKYVHKIFCGKVELQQIADSDSLQKFDFQFLNAIRDVERDMFSGKNTLLREVFDFFIDYEIKVLSEEEKEDDEKKAELKSRRNKFAEDATILLEALKLRLDAGKKKILEYNDNTGAGFNNAKPNFEGEVSESEMFSALKLVIEHETGIRIPATHNGLGYNNLIFMSLLLAKMQVSTNSEYLGSNAVVFPILAIEEPEAHLHPSMQYKFLKFLRDNKADKIESGKVRQIFVTSHSTHITSAVSLDEIICLHSVGHLTKIGYPSKCFPDTENGKKSKAYVERFLDATRSDMLFAQKIIFVEGLAEQVLLPVLANFNKKSLEDHHIAIINIGGRYFEHFLYLLDSDKPHTINKKVCCITDRDPERKKNTPKSTYTKCYPFEYEANNNDFEYQNHSEKLINKYAQHSNIRFYSQDREKGKTFEYDLAWHNPNSKILLTDSISNKEELSEMMDNLKNTDLTIFFDLLRSSGENERIEDGIRASTWSDDEKKKAIISARYLNSIGKGENALELSYVLEKNLLEHGSQSFIVPQYIKDAIEWTLE